MDITYYVDGIRDELDGAGAYAKKATTVKKEHPDWASIYSKMAEAELGHAQNLVKIFEDDWKSAEAEKDDLLSQVHDSVLSMYAENAARVKSMLETYTEM